MERAAVLRTLSQHESELRQQYGVKSLALFGSAARDEATPASDIDLLVEFDRPVGLLHLIGTEQHLEAILGADVDLILRRAILPELRAEILAEAVDVL